MVTALSGWALVLSMLVTSALGQNLKIAAAADLEPVLPSLMASFEQQTHVHAEAVYASSATLATQIVNGAPYGLFLAADMSFAEKVGAGTPVPYARGTLVLWARRDSPAQPLRFASLASLDHVAVANPEHAPYGRAARAAMAHLGLRLNLVVAENIAQTAQFAESGQAQAGFLSLTSALTPRLASEGSYLLVPADAYPPLLQGAVVLHGSSDGQKFLTWLLSPAVRRELATRGLGAP